MASSAPSPGASSPRTRSRKLHACACGHRHEDLRDVPVPATARTPGTPDRCEWVFCKEPGAGELRGHYGFGAHPLPWTCCAVHLDPHAHPLDLRNKLVRWA